MAIRGAGGQPGYERCVTVAASDTVSQATGPSDAIVFLTTGNATCIDAAGNSVVFTAMPAGTVVPVKLIRVNLTGYTAVIGFLYY